MKIKFLQLIILSLLLGLSVQCRSDEKKDRGISLLSKAQEKELGLQMRTQIANDPAQFNILDPNDPNNAEAYAYLNDIKDEIFKSDEFITYDAEEYDDWEFYLIDEDVLNAFAVPGGYMYFYTGLIKYLDDEAGFAGVVGHEMAHVELRHSARTMTKAYGLNILTQIIVGNDSSAVKAIVAQLAAGAASLAFSRDFEYQADEYSVRFLTDTDYDPRGAASFFEKLEADESITSPPEFFSTHPNPDNRVEAIYEEWTNQGEPTGELYTSRYQDFINALP